MKEKKLKINRPCRKCKKIPKEGFYLSRILRYDWICPKCCDKSVVRVRKKRIKRIKKLMEEGKNK